MKKTALYISIVVVLLIAGFAYLRLVGTAGNPFRKIDSGSPTVTTENDNEKLVFKNYGSMPEFKNVSQWFNGDAPTPETLKGKVVLVNFWTYSCIGCIHLLPSLNQWQETYQ